MAVIASWPWLAEALEHLGQVLRTKASRFRDEPRMARTCLQDAVAVTFGDLFGGYEAALARAAERIAREVEELHAVNLGGTIVGRPQDAPEGYRREILPSLRVVSGDPAYRSAPNLFDAAQNPDGLVAVSSGLDLLARVLIKAAKDLRLLSSGPEAGLGEIRLPAVQPGSSIMPGKVNPVIPEFVIQCCFQVLGNHAACAGVLDHGELDLNVWESVLLFNVLDSMRLLANAAHTLGRAMPGGGDGGAGTQPTERRLHHPPVDRPDEGPGVLGGRPGLPGGGGRPAENATIVEERRLDLARTPAGRRSRPSAPAAWRLNEEEAL